MAKQKNTIDKAYPPADKERFKQLRDAHPDEVIRQMWASLLRAGTYIQLLQYEAEFFDFIKVQPVKQVITDQIVSTKRYQLKLASMFAGDDKGVVDILSGDMEEDAVNDVAELVDMAKQFNDVSTFVQVCKLVSKLTDCKDTNKNIFEKIENILGSFKKAP